LMEVITVENRFLSINSAPFEMNIQSLQPH
jgi:hypothetical protein